ncbi:DUF2793 domain-containing protein [Litoreibacter roseus]|uniref:Ribonuclease III n=1 Tax=Litoreibacter roseus TaxID=2601869 RepID=A0A6N6JMY3_9RHOB|nr:DUF2793 domain-containing protein [Litoreibacter roseus]GFE66698.1 ribonuclease III [Litoreibacter roseus]
MTNTTHLKLPLIAAAQAQKHVTMNEALARIDAALHLSAISRSITNPPSAAQDGDTYLVADGAAEDWLGQTSLLAVFLNGGWEFLSPQIGWSVFIQDEAVKVTFDGTSWRSNILSLSRGGAATRTEVIEIDHVFSAAPAVSETTPLIPAGCSVLAVTGRVLSGFDGDATDWSLGVDGAETRYGSGYGVDTGAFLKGVTGQPVAYYEDTPLRITAATGALGSGVVRLCAHTIQFDLPDPL